MRRAGPGPRSGAEREAQRRVDREVEALVELVETAQQVGGYRDCASRARKTTETPQVASRSARDWLHVLNLEEGTFGRMLGFIPYGVRLNAVSSVTEALEADHRIGPRERDLLETMYRELVRQRDQAKIDIEVQPDPEPSVSARSATRSRNSASN